MEYDEETELTRYVWDYFGSFMSEFEQRVGRAMFWRLKAVASTNPNTTRLLNERWGLVGDQEIDAALADGFETFRRRVARRVMEQHGVEVSVNRCHACRRVVRTPRAQQCFWCGHDWHSVVAWLES
jgi:hypothetical protein